jgi:hypothetical protein
MKSNYVVEINYLIKGVSAREMFRSGRSHDELYRAIWRNINGYPFDDVRILIMTEEQFKNRNA